MPVAGAVQEYQTDPPSNRPEGGSPASLVDSTVVPAALAGLPDSTCEEAKLSFAGGAAAAAVAHRAAQTRAPASNCEARLSLGILTPISAIPPRSRHIARSGGD